MERIYRNLVLLSAMTLGAVAGLESAAQGRHDMSQMCMDKLNRGVVAVRESPDTVVVSWRYLSSDPANQSFDVYRDGRKVNRSPLTDITFFKDTCHVSDTGVKYEVRALKGSKDSGSWQLPANAPEGYIDIPLDKPERGTDVFGNEYGYNANDASIGDVDGDGQFEIFLKWDPTNARDNAHNGMTGPTYIDCYRLDGTRLWRIDLGDNIRSGAHYLPFLVADFDGDGRAELICRTADGTMDGTGCMIGNRKADYRNIQGRIIAGPEFLSVFNGLTGEAMATVDYIPPRGDLRSWGDSNANRSDRFLAALAWLDGKRPSAVMCRGYYTRSVLAAYDWDGRDLNVRWVFDSNTPGNEAYAGQGNHNLRVADVDGDGCDEIIYGQMTVDHDGTGLYSTGMYHGDAMHLLSDINNEKYYVWGCHENGKDGTSLRDAATGKVIFQFPSNQDIGRCMAADIDPSSPGVELWSPSTGGVVSFDGRVISPEPRQQRRRWPDAQPGERNAQRGQAPQGGLNQQRGQDYRSARVPVNMAVWWDGDLLREMLDGNRVSKYNPATGRCDLMKVFEGTVSNNGTKANPCLQADIVGDWREEVLMRTPDSSSLRLYVTTIPTGYRFHTFLEDPAYRASVANQNVGYNQPTDPGFYFGPDLKGRTFRGTDVK